MAAERAVAHMALGLCLGAWLAMSALARADEPASAASVQFERGVAHVDRGEIDAAIAAFEAAHAARPHPAVLFNLGQAYSVAGRPLDAVRVLRAFLAQGAPSPQRKQEAEHLLRFNEARLGRLVVTVEPGEAVLYLDGRLLGRASELSSIELPAGAHVLSAEAPGHLPGMQQLVMEPWVAREQRIELKLEPNLTTLSGDPGATLRVQATPPRALVTVDGKAYDGSVLPSGGHWLRVALPGHAPFQQRVDLQAGKTEVLHVKLSPLAPDPLDAVARRRRVAAYVTGGVGLAAALSAIALYVFNNGRAERWRRTEWEDADRMVDDALSIQRVDNAGATCAVAAGALVVTAATLWLLSYRARPAASREALTTTPP